MPRKSLIISIAFILTFLQAQSQECETLFDLTQWSKEGTPNAYWKVLSSTEAIDTTWIFPASFFVSPNEMINVLIRGKVTVVEDRDNDFIGIVFGYKKPTILEEDNTYNFYLFDWKSEQEKSNSVNANQGFRLSYYNGYFTREDQHAYFVGAVNNPPQRKLLETKYGDTLGWRPFREYEIELRYTSTLIQISVDGKKIFEHEGCFQQGRFGFYCMSQAYALFQDFTYQQFVDFYPSKETACVDEDIVFYPYDADCGGVPGFINSLYWNFGGGTTSAEITPSHSYSQPDVYNVELIVHKNDDCSDTIIKDVTIYPNPVVNLGDDNNLPACSTITLDADNPGSSYLWSTGETTQTIELKNLDTDTIVWVVVTSSGCSNNDTIFITVESIQEQLYFPNAFTPNFDGENELFAPIGNTDNIGKYHMMIYNRWGQKIYETTDPNSGWDGTYNNIPSPLGTYVYKVSYRTEGCVEERDYSESATITLIK